jgi:FAD/FMN-containing dehydrogenase
LNNSLVIDLSHINSVSVSSDKTSATVGAGIRLGALYTALNSYGLTFHGGICPSVGLGGYVGVGGKFSPLLNITVALV